jgi:hypothetical protein
MRAGKSHHGVTMVLRKELRWGMNCADTVSVPSATAKNHKVVAHRRQLPDRRAAIKSP